MDLDALVARFPRIWHVTFPGGWGGINRSGLRSTLDLLESAGRSDEAKAVRPDITTVSTADVDATLRNQAPNRKDPAPYLDGVTVEEWWQLVNGRSYFFPTREDADKMIETNLEQGHSQEVLTFETRRLLGPVADSIHVSTVSAGVFPRTAGPARGHGTFQRLADYTGPSLKIREISVTETVPMLDAAVISVVAMAPGETPVRVFPPRKAQG